jgi:1-acyl-sn-glycerol-3-phosphate acyltransferase
MGKDNIEKYSAGYALLKYFVDLWHNNVFYRKVIVLGRDNIHPDDHIIFAPNHQNALMDAMAVLCTLKKQPVFLARADIFKSKLIASILYFLKMLPVFRIRDGYVNLKNNDKTFIKTIEVLKNKNGLVILPEGNHVGYRRLRMLKKGICRIAFQAEEATDFTLDIKIIPVGIEFSNYTRFRQVLTVVYGKPIEVSAFYELYKENPQKAINELKNLLSDRMKENMVHIESEDDYEAIDELRGLVNDRYSDDTRLPKLFRDRILINKINRLFKSDLQTYRKICDLTLSVKSMASKMKTDYRLLLKAKHSLAWLIAGTFSLLISFPLFLYGLFFNQIFIEIPKLLLKRIADIQFHSTIKYAVSLILAFILLPLYGILSFILVSPWWLAFTVFLSIPLSGLFAWNYGLLYNRVSGGFRIRKYISENNPEYLLLKNYHTELMNLISKL